MNTPHSSTLRLLSPTPRAALIAGCQDRASNDQNSAGTPEHQTLQPNNSAVPTTTAAPGDAVVHFRGSNRSFRMRYAHTPPVEPGYYWLKEGEDEEIVEVWTDPEQSPADVIFFIHRCGSGEAREAAGLEAALWAGPLELPEPPTTDVDALTDDPPA